MIIKYLFVIAIFANVSYSYASSIYIKATVGSGTNPDDLNTVQHLVEMGVLENASNQLVEKESEADFVLKPTLVKLGETYVMSLAKMKDGATIFSSQLKAQHKDELDKVAQRLVRSALSDEKPKRSVKVGEITEQESREGTERRASRALNYLGFGASNFGNLNSPGVGYSFGGAYAWDINTALLKLMAEGDFNGSAFFISGGLGANYFFSRTEFAPYVGADFGAGISKIDQGGVVNGQLVAGFVIGLAAGVELFRTSNVNLDIGFRAAMMLKNNSLGAPIAYTLRAGLYF